jgi:hypothetical protein
MQTVRWTDMISKSCAHFIYFIQKLNKIINAVSLMVQDKMARKYNMHGRYEKCIIVDGKIILNWMLGIYCARCGLDASHSG